MIDVKNRQLLAMSPKRMTNTEPRAWQRMLSGRRLDLLSPSPLDIEIEDIAHGLARVARWNGQTKGDHAFSVAQHCLLVERLAAAMKPGLALRFRRAALLHDASEYVVGDLISPFKAALALDYKDFEKRLLEAIHIRFGLPARLPAEITRLIKRADRAAAYWEARTLAGFSAEEALRYFGPKPKGVTPDLEPLPAMEAEARYLARFRALDARA
jgi:5'-deoxynucleotidase YfbR-like HD superfamily hydrolase